MVGILQSGVSSTIQKGVSETTSEHCWGCGYCDSKMSIYEAAMLGALIGAALFLGLATFTAMSALRLATSSRALAFEEIQ